MWFIGTFVGFVVDAVIFETLIAVCSKHPDGKGSRECCKRRGVYFDFEIYDKFYYQKLR
jgi:hypothetical protein